MTITPETRARLLRLCEEATPGEWFAEPLSKLSELRVQAPHYTGSGETLARHLRHEDARFIAAARSALPDLLAENERLTAALKATNTQMWEQSDRADQADAKRVGIETGKVHPSLAFDVQEHRDAAYKNGWDDGYAEGAGKVRAENERLREALKPFAKASNPNLPDGFVSQMLFAQRDLRRAAEALAGTPAEKPINQGV